jgi:hypothetical protein
LAIHLTGFSSIIDGFAAAMILEKPVEVLEDIYWLLLMPEGRSDREEWKLSVLCNDAGCKGRDLLNRQIYPCKMAKGIII